MPADDLVLVEVADEVATVTLNRPEARNALEPGAAQGAADHAARARRARRRRRHRAHRRRPRVLRRPRPQGAGRRRRRAPARPAPPARPGTPRGPVPGHGQAGDRRRSTASPSPAASSWPWPATSSWRRSGPASPTPTPASGSCRAGASPCCCPRPSAFRRAKELSTTGNFLDAATALAWGLVNHVVPHDELLPFAQGSARDIATVARPAVAPDAATYDEGALVDGAGAWALEAEVSDDVAGRRARPGRDRAEPPGRGRARPHAALGESSLREVREPGRTGRGEPSACR